MKRLLTSRETQGELSLRIIRLINQGNFAITKFVHVFAEDGTWASIRLWAIELEAETDNRLLGATGFAARPRSDDVVTVGGG